MRCYISSKAKIQFYIIYIVKFHCSFVLMLSKVSVFWLRPGGGLSTSHASWDRSCRRLPIPPHRTSDLGTYLPPPPVTDIWWSSLGWNGLHGGLFALNPSCASPRQTWKSTWPRETKVSNPKVYFATMTDYCLAPIPLDKTKVFLPEM